MRKRRRDGRLGRSQTLPIPHNQPCLLRVAARDPTALTRFSARSSVLEDPPRWGAILRWPLPEFNILLAGRGTRGTRGKSSASKLSWFLQIGSAFDQSWAVLPTRSCWFAPSLAPQKYVDRKGVLRKATESGRACGPGEPLNFGKWESSTSTHPACGGESHWTGDGVSAIPADATEAGAERACMWMRQGRAVSGLN